MPPNNTDNLGNTFLFIVVRVPAHVHVGAIHIDMIDFCDAITITNTRMFAQPNDDHSRGVTLTCRQCVVMTAKITYAKHAHFAQYQCSLPELHNAEHTPVIYDVI